MKNLRKDNKGFSLVELIVVVLIMAIIAVALAPQILKWVNNSRISSDQQTMQTVVSNVQTTLTNSDAFAAKPASFTVTNNGVQGTFTGTNANFWKKFSEYSGIALKSDGSVDGTKLQAAFKTKAKNGDSANTITINIDAKGAVQGSMDVNTDSIDN